MFTRSPAFGLMSGVATGIGLLPHLLFLCCVLVIGTPLPPIAFLIVFTIGAKLLGEWLFWSQFTIRMDKQENLKKWRLIFNRSLLSQPNVSVGMLTMFVDGCVDAAMIYLSLQTSLSPISIFLFLLGCQALSSPIQGILSDFFSQKKSLLFAHLVGILAVLTFIEIPLNGKEKQGVFYPILSLLGFSSLTLNMQVLITLCIKGLFGNMTVIARSAIARVIKIETLERFGEA